MSVLVYIESKNNKPKKNSAEVISYGKELANKLWELSVDLCNSFGVTPINL